MSSRQTEQRMGELSQFIFECEIKRKGNKRLRGFLFIYFDFSF
jgi:hypothetical protein